MIPAAQVTITLGGIESFPEVVGILAQTGAYKVGHRTFAVLAADLTTERIVALQWLQGMDEDITVTGLVLTPEQEAEADRLDIRDLDAAVEKAERNADEWWAENHG